MSVRKITQNNQVRWEVYVLSSGRGSKRLRRRFETKAEAESFLEDYKARTPATVNRKTDVITV
ncbi:MAG: hypothetical protein A2X94_15575 [Bdellovibrionales bacterium GWB1_55_8]|nr:MAG: hypothetical protein A2X94_15575 [Bdellovibrionales bacterium GWB1_55_8]